MHNIILAQKVQGYQNLDGESFDQVEGKTLEVVHLDEFVQIDREHLECDHEVLAEDELVNAANDVFLIFFILVVQVLDQLGLDQALLVETLLVFEYLKADVGFHLMVEALEDDAEAALAKLLDDLIPVVEMLIEP